MITHSVVFKSYKSRENVSRHFIVPKKCFSRNFRLEKIFFENFLFRGFKIFRFEKFPFTDFPSADKTSFCDIYISTSLRFAKSSFRNVFFCNMPLRAKVLLDFLVSIISRF